MKVLISSIFLFMSITAWTKNYSEQLEYLALIRTNNPSKVKIQLEALAEEYNHLSDIEKANYNYLRAHSESLHGNYELAYRFANSVAETSGDKSILARADSLKVVIYSYRGEIQKAFTKIYQLTDNLHRLDDDSLKLDILLNALTLHTYSGILDRAQDLSLQAMMLADKINSKKYLCRVNVEVGLLNIRLKKLKEAYQALDKVRKDCSEDSDKTTAFIVSSQLAKLNMLNGNYELAEKQYQKLIIDLEQFGWDGLLVDSQIRFSELYLKMGKHEKILKLALPAYQASEKNNLWHDLADISLVLAKHYKKTNQDSEAEQYRSQYIRSLNKLRAELQKKRLAYYQAMNIRDRKQELLSAPK